MEGAGLKPLQFATKMGKTSGAVTHWLDGRTKSLKAETAAKMETVTGYSATWIVTAKGEKKVARGTAVLTGPTPTLQASGAPSQLSDYALDLAARFDQLTTKDTRFEAMSACVALLEARAAQSRPTVLKQSNGVDVQRPPENSTG